MTLDETKTGLEAPEGSLVCRVDGCAWWLVAFFCGLSAWFGAEGLFSDDPMDVRVVDFCVSGVLMVSGAIAALWISRARIIADSEGLRWRGIWRWHAAPWDSITDYHQPLSSDRRTVPLRVEMAQRNLVVAPFFSRMDELRAVIRRRAGRALAQDWGVKGARHEDPWPREFVHQAVWLWALPVGLLLAIGPVLLIADAIKTVWSLQPDFTALGVHLPPEVEFGLLASIFAALLMLYPTIHVGTGILKTQMDHIRRLGDRVLATPEGITLHGKGKESVTILWQDTEKVDSRSIGPFGYLGRRFTVTGRDRVIVFSGLISQCRMLCATIESEAPALNGSSAWMWSSPSDYVGAPRSFWSGMQPGLGQHIHHYRMLGGVHMLWHLLAVSAIGLLLALTGPLSSTARLVGVVVSVVPLPVIVYLLWRYRYAQIRTDETGIEWRGPLGRRRMLWGDVQGFRRTGLGAGYIVQGAGRRIVFWNGISEFEDLVREIERRTARGV